VSVFRVEREREREQRKRRALLHFWEEKSVEAEPHVARERERTDDDNDDKYVRMESAFLLFWERLGEFPKNTNEERE